MNADLKVIYRGVLTLASGTVAARAVAVLSQLLLVQWLAPAEFGYWAAAVSGLAFVSGLVNFGDVNGYLSGQGAGFDATKKATRIGNLAILCVALPVAGFYLTLHEPRVAILAVIISFTLPIQGEAGLLSAVGIKASAYNTVVRSQIFAAVGKLAIAITLAICTRSAIAIAISTAAFSLIMALALHRMLDKEKIASLDKNKDRRVAIGYRVRGKWAINALLMRMPLQSGFLVAQFLATPRLVGLYFFSYQVTLGLSGLVAQPLARIGLEHFGRTEGEERMERAFLLCSVFGAGTLMVVALGTFVGSLGNVLPTAWQTALPTILVLMASLPVRMMSPIIDSLQQAENSWWQSTGFNALDAAGVGIASIAIVFGDTVHPALCLVLWKAIYGTARACFVFQRLSLRCITATMVPILVGTATLCLSAIRPPSQSWVWSCCAVLVGSCWLVGLVRRNPKATREIST